MTTFKKGQKLTYWMSSRRGWWPKLPIQSEYVQPVGNQKHLIKVFMADGSYETKIVSGKSLEVKHDDDR